MSIHGQILEVTVVGCSRLRDTEWISRQDPYVCLEYASTKHRTRTCTDGGKNPTFQDKFVLNLIEGLREINVVVWNSNSISFDDFIGSGKILLHKVLSQGYDDASWPIQSKRGKYAGEVTVIMHFPNAHKPSGAWSSTSAPPHAGAPPAPYPAYPPLPAGYPYPPAPSAYPSYPPPPVTTAPYPAMYPPPSVTAPPYPTTYPPPPMTAPMYPTTYPPGGAPYPPVYPPGPYSTYPRPPY